MSRTEWSPGCCPHLRFYGLKTCHCAACHETFSSPSAFDAHQGDARCRKPDEVGLVRRGELWKRPPRESLKPWWRQV